MTEISDKASNLPSEVPSPGFENSFKFYGSGKSLFPLWIETVFLTLLTLGVYYFWAKVRIRKYVFAQTEMEGDRFVFHGKGKEIFIGWIKAAAAFGVPFFIIRYSPLILGPSEAVFLSVLTLQVIFIWGFISFARVWTHAYRMNRTSWRGVRFSFRGKSLDYFKLLGQGAILCLLTFGFYFPAFLTRQWEFIIAHSYFGNKKFNFEGRYGKIYRIFFSALVTGALFGIFGGLLVVLIIFLVAGFIDSIGGEESVRVVFFVMGYPLLFLVSLYIRSFFYVELQRYIWDNVRIGEAQFKANIDFEEVVRLKWVNAFLLIFTLGVAYPWVRCRNARFLLERVTIQGPVNLEKIHQDYKEGNFSAVGEELGEFFDMGVDLG